MKAVLLLLVLFLISVLPASAAGAPEAEGTGPARIVELYSDIESFDATVHSTQPEEDLTLEISLVRPERGREQVIATQEILTGSFPANTRITKVGFWDIANAERGAYTINARLLEQGQVLSESEYDFVYGARAIPRIQVNNIVPNSEGVTVVLSPNQPSLLDIEYMLVDGHDVIYRAKTERVALTGMPEAFSATWGSLLENNREYAGRVKVQVYSPGREFIASTEHFTARDDAEITDVYEDETGASATVVGRSQVPFEGSLIFSVYEMQAGASGRGSSVLVESVRERVPVLLNDDDETVEVAWRERLTEGIYRLEIELIGNDGNVLERRESIIQSNIPPTSVDGTGPGTVNETPAEERDGIPGFSVIIGIIGLIIGFALLKRLN